MSVLFTNTRTRTRISLLDLLSFLIPLFLQLFAEAIVNNARFLCVIVNNALSEFADYGLETVVSVLFTNTRTRWPHNEREIFNTARGVAECSIENFEFIVLPASACICKQNTN